jgi:hypothetical protein
MNLNEYIIHNSDFFIERIQREANLVSLDVDEWGWENYLYTSPKFRQAHIERYFHPQLMVLHITIFPHKNNTFPMFGFDLIGYPKRGMIGAGFLDWSPTYGTFDWKPPKFKNKYNLPDWTDGIFSNTFVACVPEEDEYDKLFETAYTMFTETLIEIGNEEYQTKDEEVIKEIVKNQNNYCEKQWQNKRTFGALKSKVGEERAHYFMRNILFPKV